jgi:hypothetical protein
MFIWRKSSVPGDGAGSAGFDSARDDLELLTSAGVSRLAFFLAWYDASDSRNAFDIAGLLVSASLAVPVEARLPLDAGANESAVLGDGACAATREPLGESS